VHLAKIAFTTSSPAPWRPPQVSNTIEKKSTPIRPHESAHLSVPLFPLVLEERGGAAVQGPAGGRIRVDNG